MEGQYLKDIKIGMKVEIVTSQNRNSVGFVDEIATRNEFNEQGIMVRLKNGDIGRVKRLILSEPEKNDSLMNEIKKMMSSGEDFHTEFKGSALWSLNYTPLQINESKSFELKEYGQRASKVIIAKSIASFLNSDGGNIVIGVKENKENNGFEIKGINEDIKKAKSPDIDGYKRTLIDEVIRPYFPSRIFNHLNNYIIFEFVKFEDKILCWIKVKRSDVKVFLKINNKEIFMIRVDSENRMIEGEKLVDYCINKWGARQ